MKTSYKLVLILTLLISLALPGTAFARGFDSRTAADQVVLGGSYTLRSGETLNGNLVVLGGNATLEEGSRVNGDVLLFGGNVQAANEIHGNVAAFGGNISLEASALVTGDVSIVGGNLSRAPGARIEGQVSNGFRGVRPFVFPFAGVRAGNDGTFAPVRLFINLIWFLFRTFLWAALAVLAMMFLPRHVERVSQAIAQAPLISGGVGLLTAVVAPLALIVLAITILLIPASLLGALLLAIAWAFGLVSLGYEVGRRLAHALDQVWAPAAQAGIGTFILMFIVDGVNGVFGRLGLLGCVVWILPFLAGILGLGAVLLTRFGTAIYPPFGLEPPSILRPDVPPPSPRMDWPPAPPAGPVVDISPAPPAGPDVEISPTPPPSNPDNPV